MVQAFDDRIRKTRVEQVVDQLFGKSAGEQEPLGRALSIPCKQRKRSTAIGGTFGNLRNRHEGYATAHPNSLISGKPQLSNNDRIVNAHYDYGFETIQGCGVPTHVAAKASRMIR
jgi:hypothetical protein